jgi:hypothetical protein
VDVTAVRQRIVERMRYHPRISYQGLMGSPTELQKLVEKLPPLLPFPSERYHDLFAILDWDHKLPSAFMVLRIFCYYSAATARGGDTHYERRLQELKIEDKFPEFDIPDFVGIAADEEYEAVFTIDGNLDRCRLRSPWRHQVQDNVGKVAIEVTAKSEALAELEKEHPDRERSLGGPEPAGWCPPCESGHSRWTVDVWYLLTLTNFGGEGRSFLVDVQDQRLVAVRSFLVRP